jgi:hypothetical protein
LSKSPIEDLLLQQLHEKGIHGAMRECTAPWDATKRHFRGDICFPEQRLLCEVNGGGGRGRHTSFAGYSRDRVKANLAQLAGWTVLEATSQQVKDGSALNWIAAALGKEPLVAGVHPPARRKKKP